jgi:hypothetical protein
MEWYRRRPTAAAALVYALLALAFYAPALVPGRTLSASDYLWTAAPWGAERPADVRPFGSNLELVDTATQFQPFLRYTRERLLHPPLWNPYIASGRPFLANAQSAVLSPFSLPVYVLPFWWSLGIAAALKVFAAAFGTYLLGRALGMRFGGALLAGLVYGWGLFFIVWVPWPLADVWAWLPWLLVTADRAVRRPTPRAGAALAAVVAAQFFGGHPESSFHLLVVTAAFVLVRIVVLRREGSLVRAGPAVLTVAGGVALGAALAAITLVPFLELLSHSNDVTVRQDYWRLRLPREYLLGFALPEYWGRGTQTGIGDFAQTRAVYVGILPLVLGAAAILVRPTLQRVSVAVFGAFVLAIVVGLWPLPTIISHLPIVRTGNHLRLVVIFALCAALLAGWGFDDLAGGRRQRRTIILAVACALVTVPVLVLGARGQLAPELAGRAFSVAWRFAAAPAPQDPDAPGVIRLAALFVALPFLVGAAALVAARLWGRVGMHAFLVLGICLVVVDIFRAGMGQTPAIDTSSAEQPSTAALRYLKDRRPARFVGLERALGPSPIPPNVAMREGLYDARSYDFPVEEHYDRLWRRAIAAPGDRQTDFPTTKAVLTPRSLPALRLLSVTDVVQDPAERPIRRPGLPLAYDGPDARIYRNPGALPRAAVIDAQSVLPDEREQLQGVLSPRFDGRRRVITASPLPGLRATPGKRPAGQARIVRYDPERVVIEATARRPSEMVLTDLYYPGWKATVDGEDKPVNRVNWMLRGVSLPPGRHTVELRYEPASWTAGVLVSLAAALGLLVVLARRRRA